MRSGQHRPHKPYPAYKPSGIEWLGEIPADWEVKRLKFVVQLINHKIDAMGSDLPYLGLEHIESWTGRLIEDEGASSEGTANKFQPNDVLFGKLRPYLAKVFLSEFEGICTTEALVLRVEKELIPRFLMYYLLSPDFIDVVNGSTFGSKMPRASWEFVGSLPQLLPSFQEQQAIVDFLDAETARLDALAAKKQRLIALLKEKRQALISHAVTKGLDPNVPLKPSGIPWLGEIPIGWEIYRPKNLAGNAVEVVQTGPFGAQLHASDYVPDGVPVMRVQKKSMLKQD